MSPVARLLLVILASCLAIWLVFVRIGLVGHLRAVDSGSCESLGERSERNVCRVALAARTGNASHCRAVEPEPLFPRRAVDCYLGAVERRPDPLTCRLLREHLCRELVAGARPDLPPDECADAVNSTEVEACDQKAQARPAAAP